MNKKTIHHSVPVAAHTKRLFVSGRARTRICAQVGGGVVLGIVALLVMTTRPVVADTQGYRSSDNNIQNGMVVAAKEVKTENGVAVTYVEKSSASRAEKTIGIVVDQRNGAVTASEPGSTLYVASGGTAIAYVSDINGKVKQGDLVVASPIEGVLMRSTVGTNGVLGIAMQDFPEDSSTEVVSLEMLNGRKTEARIATVQINMDTKVAKNSADVSKSILQRIGEALVRREVTSTQAFIATVIFVLLLIVVGGIIYAAVSSSIISLGRNPFARKTILRSLLQVTILVGVVLAVGLGAIYWVLWI